MTASRPTLSITIRPKDGKGYKLIKELQWENVPPLAILTGRNGSGKTQLLEVLAHHLTDTLPHDIPQNVGLPVSVTLDGEQFSPHEVSYVPSFGRFSGGGSSSIGNLQGLREQAVSLARQINSFQHDIVSKSKAMGILHRFGGRHPNQMTETEIQAALPDDYEFLISDADVTEGITHVFLAHRFKMLESMEGGREGLAKDGTPLPPPPWTIVNEALKVAGFPYEVVSPAETSIAGHYQLKLRDTQSEEVILANDLSSGEKVILQLVLWLYSSSKSGIFPRLLLLDEPDAHLHPSMTTQFLDVISEVLVGKYGVRVIMTTHSPSTVALAPIESICQISRSSNKVVQAKDHYSVVSELTSGIVAVSKATKFCFVEDEADVDFYNAIRDILTDYGPSRDPMSLLPSPTIAFIAASVGKGSTKIAGGSSIVKKWVEKLDASPLDKTFFGILDRDVGSPETDRIRVIGRYSFENYLLDPLNIFGLLLEASAAPALEGVPVSSGDEHLLRGLPLVALQSITDWVTAKMEAADSNLATPSAVSVAYTIGKSVKVPQWLIDYRGHDLLPIAQAAFGGSSLISPPRLIRALKRGRLVPQELATLLHTIQAT